MLGVYKNLFKLLMRGKPEETLLVRELQHSGNSSIIPDLATVATLIYKVVLQSVFLNFVPRSNNNRNHQQQRKQQACCALSSSMNHASNFIPIFTATCYSGNNRPNNKAPAACLKC